MEEQKEQTAKEPAAGAQPGFGKLLRSLREKAGLSLDVSPTARRSAAASLKRWNAKRCGFSLNLSTSGPLSATSAA